MVLQESDKQRVKDVFKAVYEVTEEAKELNNSAKDMKASLARELGVKKEVINQAYSQWVRMVEKPEIINSVDEILESIR